MSDSDSDNATLPFDFENGYQTETTYRSSSDESATGDNSGRPNVFDTDLPATHTYLGKLDNVSGYTLFDDGQVITALAFYTNTLVFPGFTLPLVIHDQYEGHHMEKLIVNKELFVLVFSVPERWLFDYGVTMEIYETTLNRGILSIKARGRQRCKVIQGSVRQLGGRILQATVKVLPEPEVSSPIGGSMLMTLKKTRHNYVKDFDSIMRDYKTRRYHLSQYPIYSWLLDRHEPLYFVKQIIKGLGKFYAQELLPRDPVALSYWFVQNFQLTQQERLNILRLNSAIERLRNELYCLHTQRVICCDLCKADIAQQSDVFAMSKDGVQSNYCNPGGHVYETVTVSKAKNYLLTGRPSKQFSWFPGYAWTIMNCKICRQHLGWQFTSKHLVPNCFYGLAKSGLDIKVVKNDD